MVYDHETCANIQKEIKKCIQNNVLQYNPFRRIDSYKDNRIFTCDNIAIVKTEEIENNKDNIIHEYHVGEILNRFRKFIPYFVYTFAYFDTNPPVAGYPPCTLNSKLTTTCLCVERISGETSKFKNFTEAICVFFQVMVALEIARKNFGFTHYNLHSGNVLCVHHKHPIQITIDNLSVITHIIPVIIDFGRSYTDITGGHVLQKKRVEKRENWFHDTYSYIYSAIAPHYRRQAEKLCNFYGATLGDRIYSDIERGEKHAKYQNVNELARFIYKEFKIDVRNPFSYRNYKPFALKKINPSFDRSRTEECDYDIQRKIVRYFNNF